MSSSGHRLDNQRENWVLLVLGTEKNEGGAIDWWELIVGNATQIVRSHAGKVGVNGQNESQVLASLLESLEQYRDEEPLLITPLPMVLNRLRARLVQVLAEQLPSLRGFRHLCLDKQLEEYFTQTLSDRDLDIDLDGPVPPETEYGDLTLSDATFGLWELWTSIYPLLPLKEINGERL